MVAFVRELEESTTTLALGLRLLASMVDRAVPGSARRLELAVAETAQGRWEQSDRWPKAKRRILQVAAASEPKAALPAALADAGKVMAELNEGAERELTRLTAQGFGRGYEFGMATAGEVQRGVVERQAGVGDDAASGRLPAPDEMLEGTPLLEYVDPVEPFTVADVKAFEWLAADTNFWIRDAWTNELGGRIAKAAQGALVEGVGRKELARRLEASLSQYDEPRSYWNVVASASMVRARSYGAVSGMGGAGVTRFRFRAIMDERTSPICRSMNGQIFTIEQGQQHIASVSQTQGQQLKDAAPWVPPSEVAGKSSADLAAMGVMLPPVHGNCRSTVVAESFAPIAAPVTPEPEPELPPEEQPMPDTLQLGAEDVRAKARVAKLDPDRHNATGSYDAAAFADSAEGLANEAELLHEGGMVNLDRFGASRLSRAESNRARREVDTLLGQYGMSPEDGGNMGRGLAGRGKGREVMVIGNRNKVSGQYDYVDDTVKIRRDQLDSMVRSLSTGERPVDGVHTFVHEAIHGYSRYVPGVYRGAGRVVEEVSVDSVARRVMADQFAASASDADVAAIMGRGGYGKTFIRTMDEFNGSAKKIAGGRWDPDRLESLNLMADAGIRMRRPGVKVAETPAEHARNFVDAIHPPASAKMSKAEVRQFRDDLHGRLMDMTIVR